MKNIALIFISLLIITNCNSKPDIEKYKKHVEILSSDDFEGRAPGTPGGIKTKNYIASHFESLNLESFNNSKAI